MPQAALSKLADFSGLCSLTVGNLNSLFIVSKPEAAAVCALAEDNNDMMVS
jgi:hypothetical protein